MRDPELSCATSFAMSQHQQVRPFHPIFLHPARRRLGSLGFQYNARTMLSAEDNELLTRTGPGTPMGDFFRRFWMPVLLSQELPELSELSHLVTGLPAFAGLRPFFDNHLLRLEDESKEGLYEVRAELPGVDPIEGIEVTVLDGRLTIKALRTRSTESNGLSEFS